MNILTKRERKPVRPAVVRFAYKAWDIRVAMVAGQPPRCRYDTRVVRTNMVSIRHRPNIRPSPALPRCSYKDRGSTVCMVCWPDKADYGKDTDGESDR